MKLSSFKFFVAFHVIFIVLLYIVVDQILSVHSLSLNQAQINKAWESFKQIHNREYLDEAEHLKRKMIFARNMLKILIQNEKAEKGELNFQSGINKFSDITHEEFIRTRLGFKTNNNKRGRREIKLEDVKLEAETNLVVDWRRWLNQIKDQGQCGSCWAFSSVSAMEMAYYLNSSKLVQLSEQNLVDCVTEASGCNGGLMDVAFQYTIQNGISSESAYLYVGGYADNSSSNDSKCNITKPYVLNNYVDISNVSENDLMRYVAKYGSISIAMDATNLAHYKSGLFDLCSQTTLNHAVNIVGYNASAEPKYWIVRNSWGPMWGEEGYFRMVIGKNMCNLNAYKIYAIF